MMIAKGPCVLRDAPSGLHPEGAPQDDEDLYEASKLSVILRRPRSGRLEGRTSRSTGLFIGQAAILLIVVLALAGCGRKGAPQPPPDEPNTYPRTYPSA
jgi:hypothetical protein